MKKILITFCCLVLILLGRVYELRAEPLQMNQLHYRTAIITVLPDGYDHSLEDLLKLFGASDESASKDPADQIHIKSQKRKIEIAYLDQKTEEERVYKKWVTPPDVRFEVDQLINRLNGIASTPEPREKIKDTHQQKRAFNPNSSTKRSLVYRGTDMTIKGNLPDYIDFKDAKGEPKNTTALYVVFRNNMGHVYYRRMEDKLLRSLNKNIPLDQVQGVVDGFLDAMGH